MRRLRSSLFALVLFFPTAASAAYVTQDPNGQPLTQMETWLDALVRVLITHVGI